MGHHRPLARFRQSKEKGNRMSLKPEASIGTGLAVAAVVYAIHSNFTPSMADLQGLPAGNLDTDAAERKATWLSAGVVAGVSLIARDPDHLCHRIGDDVAMAWFSRHATWTESKAGPAVGAPGQSAVSANDNATGPQMTTADYQMFGHTEFVTS
jgi:preprotein translocase subunit Sec61beta